MVFTSPFSNIKAFITSKPPLVLFTICLMGFAITTFTFAYYVEHTEDLPNIDAQRDLVSFLAYLSKKKLCVTPTEISQSRTNVIKNDSDELTVAVRAKLSGKLLYPNITNIQGYITTSDWLSECLTIPVNKVKLSFALPMIANATAIEDIEMCVLITGPKDLLLPASGNDQCLNPTSVLHPVGNIMNRTLEDSHRICSDGISESLSLTYQANKHNALLLDVHDRSVINLHLFHTSYFLLVMAVTLICYAMIKGKPTTKHQPVDNKMSLDVYEH